MTFKQQLYSVVINIEKQFSVWPVGKGVPRGWRIVNGPAAKAECLAFIDANWIDMTPATLRDALEATESQPPQ